ncbi:MAG: hypothetical protein J6E48_01465 [Prevotella sp.]|nr:hypothetical protein [Prevotella sp.]
MKKKKASEMVANDFGIMIKKCCGSCHNRGFDEQERRCCQLTGKHVRGCAVCDDWSMSDGLKILGCERGKVQRREYQLSLIEVRTSELNAVVKGEDNEPASVESIRRDFELKHGSRFLIR